MAAARRRSITEIESEIARSRAGLDLTLDALAVELAPKHLVEKAADMVTQSLGAKRPGGIARGGGRRADPVPLALIGLGAAWLVAENTGLLDRIVPGRGGHAAPGTAPGGDAAPGDAKPGDAKPGSAAPGDGWGHQAAEAARDALRSIRDGGGAALERAGEYIEGAAHSGERARLAGGRLIKRLEDNPLAYGLAAIICGAVAAVLLPSGRREREIVARAREDLLEKAEELGHCAAGSIRAMARDSTDATTGG